MQQLPGSRGAKPPGSRRLLLQLREDKDTTSLSEEAVDRMARLIGDPCKAACKVDKLRTITKNLDEREIEAEAEVIKAMADPCRLKILQLLKEGELCVCEIMIALDRPQSTTSHHLSILRNAGLIKERKDGRWSRYRLSEGAVIEMLNLVKLIRVAKLE
jgi:DNA-binding transcriptional ArsR family regulator